MEFMLFNVRNLFGEVARSVRTWRLRKH